MTFHVPSLAAAYRQDGICLVPVIPWDFLVVVRRVHSDDSKSYSQIERLFYWNLLLLLVILVACSASRRWVSALTGRYFHWSCSVRLCSLFSFSQMKCILRSWKVSNSLDLRQSSFHFLLLADVANGFHFIPVNRKMKHSEALENCHNFVAELAVIETDVENHQVTSLTTNEYCEPPGWASTKLNFIYVSLIIFAL